MGHKTRNICTQVSDSPLVICALKQNPHSLPIVSVPSINIFQKLVLVCHAVPLLPSVCIWSQKKAWHLSKWAPPSHYTLALMPTLCSLYPSPHLEKTQVWLIKSDSVFFNFLYLAGLLTSWPHGLLLGNSGYPVSIADKPSELEFKVRKVGQCISSSPKGNESSHVTRNLLDFGCHPQGPNPISD